ncbi:MAG: PEP-CTERM sorting domain-containing protein [Edaphobacter sp.]
MKIRSLLVAAVLVSATLAARADSFTTFNVNSTYLGGATVDGTLTLDTTTDMFTAANLTVTGSSTSPTTGFPQGFTLTDITSQGEIGALGQYDLQVRSTTAENSFVDLAISTPTGSLAGFNGGTLPPFGGLVDILGHEVDVTSGSLAPAPAAVTPEPGSLLLLATGLMGLAGSRWRRFAAA